MKAVGRFADLARARLVLHKVDVGHQAHALTAIETRRPTTMVVYKVVIAAPTHVQRQAVRTA